MQTEQTTFNNRLKRRIMKVPNGCTYWIGNNRGGRIGKITHNGELKKVSVAVWEEHNGPMPEGTELTHTCENIAGNCVAIEHLALVETKKCPDNEPLSGQGYLELQSDTCGELYDFVCALEAFVYIKQQKAFSERINKGGGKHKAGRNGLCDGKAFAYEDVGTFIQEYTKCLVQRQNETKD